MSPVLQRLFFTRQVMLFSLASLAPFFSLVTSRISELLGNQREPPAISLTRLFSVEGGEEEMSPVLQALPNLSPPSHPGPIPFEERMSWVGMEEFPSRAEPQAWATGCLS